jgi:hypothetical protein
MFFMAGSCWFSWHGFSWDGHVSFLSINLLDRVLLVVMPMIFMAWSYRFYGMVLSIFMTRSCCFLWYVTTCEDVQV